MQQQNKIKKNQQIQKHNINSKQKWEVNIIAKLFADWTCDYHKEKAEKNNPCKKFKK